MTERRRARGGAERDVVGGFRRRYAYLLRAGVTARIKRVMRRRERRETKPDQPQKCRPYYCPTAGDYECCGYHCGFDVCCDAPHLHRHLDSGDVVVTPHSEAD